jgi:hypothetical protein
MDDAAEWVARLSHKWEINRAEPQAYVYYQPTASKRCIVPVRFKPGQSMASLETRDWLADDRFADVQLSLLHWLDADHIVGSRDGNAGESNGGLGILYNCMNGWGVNYGALRMLADWFLWEGGKRWAPCGPVVLFRPANATNYPLDAFVRDWPLRFRSGMPYTRDDFDADGAPHAQLQETRSAAASQELRFAAMCDAFVARRHFGTFAWDQLNVY